jgi:hypothetical protein
MAKTEKSKEMKCRKDVVTRDGCAALAVQNGLDKGLANVQDWGAAQW